MKSNKSIAKENLKKIGVNTLVKDIRRVASSKIYEVAGNAFIFTNVELRNGEEYRYFRNIATNELYKAVDAGKGVFEIGEKY